MKKSYLEEITSERIRWLGYLLPEREYKFHPERKWRFDFAWPEKMIAIECEGGIWSGGRHTRGIGFINDCEKYNEATILGWRILRVTTSTTAKDLQKYLNKLLDI